MYGARLSAKCALAIAACRRGFGIPRLLSLPSAASANSVTMKRSNSSAGATVQRNVTGSSPAFQNLCTWPGATVTTSPGSATSVSRPAFIERRPATTSNVSDWFGWTCAIGTPPPGATVTSISVYSPFVSAAVSRNVMVSPVTSLARVSPERITAVTSGLLGGINGRCVPSSSSISARPSSSPASPRASWGHPKIAPTLSPMEEIGLFPLGMVLVPTERIPLHIFEPRYRELIGECIEEDKEFGLVYADEGGVRELGTRATVSAILERFDDGRLNIVVEGGARFVVERLTEGREFLTAEVRDVHDEPEPVEDDARADATGAFRALAALAGVEPEFDEESPQLSFQLAAQVELAADEKQRLLESRSEQERLVLVAELFHDARRTLIATRELGERAKRNGHR